MFTQRGLVDQLDKMKVDWIRRLERVPSHWGVSWQILHNIDSIDGFKIDRDLASISTVSHGSKPKTVVFSFPIRSFTIDQDSHPHGIQFYAAQTEMLPLKHCIKSTIATPMMGSFMVYGTQSFLVLEYQMPEAGSISTMSAALQQMINEDLRIVEYNTRILGEEVRSWLRSNMPEIEALIMKHRQNDTADPMEDLVNALADDMGFVRAKSCAYKD